MPTLQQHHAIAIREAYSYERPLAISPIRIGHSRTLPHCHTATQVPYRGDQLLYKIGRSRTIGHYYKEKYPELYLEKHHLSLRDPKVFISNNGKQFNNDAFRDFCQQLGIKNHYSSPAHPQANGQVEVINRSLLKMIKTRLEGTKGIWLEELPGVLWAYRTTACTPTGETPFCLVYEQEAIIRAEVGLTSYRVSHHNEKKNEEGVHLQLDFLDEVRAMAE